MTHGTADTSIEHLSIPALSGSCAFWLLDFKYAAAGLQLQPYGGGFNLLDNLFSVVFNDGVEFALKGSGPGSPRRPLSATQNNYLSP